MAEELIGDQNASQIFLRALREYSESCEPPNLKHDCPFAIEISPGHRGCGEECMDLLGRYGAPRPVDSVSGANGLTIRRSRRPRPRHSATRDTPAFDARASYLSESKRSPIQQWSLQSLLYRLKELVQTPPWAYGEIDVSRSEHITNITQLLSARGLELSKHLDSAIRQQVRMSLFQLIAPSQIAKKEAPNEVEIWRKYITESMEVTKSITKNSQSLRVKNTDSSLFQMSVTLGLWSDLTSLESVIGWEAPKEKLTDMLNSQSNTKFDESFLNERHNGKWIFDRFTETYIDRWDTESLCREWSFIHGQIAPPCSPFELKSREVKVSALSQEMSDRLIKVNKDQSLKFTTSRTPEHQTGLMTSQLVKPAVGFLGQGRFTEAQALFEAILQMDPSDPDANNNLGFCLIPQNPELSLKYFDESEKLFGKRSEILSANRMLALASLGRRTIVAEIATSEFGLNPDTCERSEYKSDGTDGAYLWNIGSILNNADAVLEQVSNVRNYASTLLAEIRDRNVAI